MDLAGILRNKPISVISVTPETSIRDVVKLLGEKRIGAVLVIDANQQLAGILSERDVVRKLATHAAATLDLTAAELMTPNPRTASPQITVEKAMEIMTDGRFRHIPILEGGAVIGLVSIGDVVKARIDQQKFEVESLRAYVAGAPA
jgi:CBS domain-containing protein